MWVKKKNWGGTKIGGPKKLGPKNIWVNLGKKKIWVKKNFSKKKNPKKNIFEKKISKYFVIFVTRHEAAR